MSARHLDVDLGFARLRVEKRTVAVVAVLLLVLATTAVLALMLGDYDLGPLDVLQGLIGLGGDPLAEFFVREQRLPRVVAAVLVGAALGVSGAVLQSLSGNPLGSPDIIGFTVGAATGALVQIIVLDAGPAGAAVGAVLGGIGTAIVIYSLAYRHGLSGQRLVLVGIGVAVTLQALNALLVVRASLGAAQTAAQWLAGSFNATTWQRVELIGIAVLVLVPAGLVLGRGLAPMALGDDLATGLGVQVERYRLGLVTVCVALVAVATATAGPIAFIALAAPQLARRLTRSAHVGLVPAALMGAVLVLASDIVAQRLLAPTQLAVGVVTGALGGVYLIWLLAWEWRRA